MDLLDKDKYILHGVADSIREHNRIHKKKERNAVFITAHLDFAAKLIDLLADDKIAVVKHGRWNHVRTAGVISVWKCSECDSTITENSSNTNPANHYKFCYNCGAKMDGGIK